jgi:hypothetical protein
MDVDRCSFHPPVCFLPLLGGTASMEISGGGDYGKRSRVRENVKENVVMKAKNVPSR